MKCGLCSWEFDENEARSSACAGCLKFGDCHMIKCPKCGYEVPEEPGWIKRIAKQFRKVEEI